MSMQTNEARILITAQDQASGPLGAVRNQFQKIMGSADGLRNRLDGIGGGAFGRMSGQLGQIHSKMAALGLVSGGIAVGGILSVHKAMELVSEGVTKFARVGDLGKSLQLDAPEFQVLEKLAKDSGSSIDAVGGAFLAFRNNLQLAESEGGDSLKKLNQNLDLFGLTAKAALAMPPLKLMEELGRISSLSQTEQDKKTKDYVYNPLFGETGKSQIAAIENIGAAYTATYAKMATDGELVSSQIAQQASNAKKAMENSKRAMDGLWDSFSIPFIGVYEKFALATERHAKENRTAIQPGVNKLRDVLSDLITPELFAQFDKIVSSFGNVFTWIGKIAGLIGWDKLVFGSLALVAAPFIVSIAVATGSIVGFGAALLTPVFAPLIAGITATSGVLQLLGSSAIKAWALVLAPVVLVGAAVAGAAYLIYSNWGGVSSFFAGVWDVFKGAFEPIMPLFDMLGGALTAAKDWFFGLLGPIGASSAGFQDWSNAGRLAGAVIGETLTFLLTPIYAVIDAFKLMGATWDYINGKGFNFESSTAAALNKNFFSDAFAKNAANDTKNQTANWPISGGAAAAAKAAGVVQTPMAANSSPLGVAATPAFRSLTTPVPLGSISTPMPPLAAQKVDVGGRLDVRITADGKANVERVASNNRSFEIDARAGGMYSAGA